MHNARCRGIPGAQDTTHLSGFRRPVSAARQAFPRRTGNATTDGFQPTRLRSRRSAAVALAPVRVANSKRPGTGDLFPLPLIRNVENPQAGQHAAALSFSCVLLLFLRPATGSFLRMHFDTSRSSIRPATPIATKVSVTVKWYDPTKGFGFVSPDDGADDAFLHASVIQAAGHDRLLEGRTLIVGQYRSGVGHTPSTGWVAISFPPSRMFDWS